MDKDGKLGINDLTDQFGGSIMNPRVEEDWAVVQRGLRDQQVSVTQTEDVKLSNSRIAELNGFTKSFTDQRVDEQFSGPQHG